MINAKEAKIRTQKQLKVIEEEKEKERREWEDVTIIFGRKPTVKTVGFLPYLK